MSLPRPYQPVLATPRTLDEARFWVTNELRRIAVSFGEVNDIIASFDISHTLYGDAHTDVNTDAELIIGDGLFWTGDAFAAATRMNWRGDWAPGLYHESEVTRDGNFTMVANKLTTDRAAPQPTGPAEYVLDITDPGWANNSTIGTALATGVLYTSPNDVIVRNVRVYTHAPDANVFYRLLWADFTDPAFPIVIPISAQFQSVTEGWTEKQVETRVALADTTFGVLLQYFNTSEDVSIQHNYAFTSGGGPSTPGPGACYYRTSQNTFTFHKEDADGGTGHLDPVTPGVTIEAAGSSWSILSITETADTYIYDVTAASAPAAGTYTFTFRYVPETGVALQWHENLNYWSGVFPGFTQILGWRYLDGNEETSTTAYGVDAEIQPFAASPDWELLAFSGASGIGGGGGDPGGGGDVSGPDLAVPGNLSIFQDASGKLIADSGIAQTTVTGHIADTNIHYPQTDIDHLNLQNTGVYPHAQIDLHIDDSDLHFPQSAIDHTQLQNIGLRTHDQIDLVLDSAESHIADLMIHFTVAQIDHGLIQNVGTNSHATLDLHLADDTIHFSQGAIDHAQILNIGLNSHAALDAHVADATIHFTEGEISHSRILDSGLTSHADLDAHVGNLSIHYPDAPADNELYLRQNNTWVVFSESGVTFPLLAPDGAVGTPSYSFSGNTGTGMWRSADPLEQINLSVNGLLVLEVNAFGLETRGLVNAEVLAQQGEAIDDLFAPLTHVARTEIHFEDAPTNSILYGRINNTWQEITPDAVEFPLLAPDGAAGAPSYSFAGNTGTGIFRTTDPLEEINLSVSGLLVLEVNAFGIASRGIVEGVTLVEDGQPLDQRYAPLTHVARADIHFEDATADGTQYVRQDNAWQAITFPDPPPPDFPLLGPDGAVGTPTYSFAGNTGTGWWRASDPLEQINASINGLLVLEINAFGIETRGLVNAEVLAQQGEAIDDLFAPLSHVSDTTIHFADAPANSIFYGRINNAWQEIVFPPTDIQYPLLAPNGTAAAPSYAFEDSPNTGIYRDLLPLPAIRVSIAGTDIGEFNSFGFASDQIIDGGLLRQDGVDLDNIYAPLTHVANTSIHFPDAPTSGGPYGRQGGNWVTLAGGDPVGPGIAKAGGYFTGSNSSDPSLTHTYNIFSIVREDIGNTPAFRVTMNVNISSNKQIILVTPIGFVGGVASATVLKIDNFNFYIVYAVDGTPGNGSGANVMFQVFDAAA